MIFEAPKSLQYRLLYWAGTTDVIAESPVFGTGPGNFRESYLRHKWPETSEEILDPHNVLLDLWCSSGILGVIGFGGMLLCMFRWLKGDTNPRNDNAKLSAAVLWMPILWAVGCVKLTNWVQGAAIWDSSGNPFAMSSNALWLLPVFAFVVSVATARMTFSRKGMVAVFGSLILHLCASGGMQISIIGLLIVVLFAVAEPDSQSETVRTSPWAHVHAAGFATLAILVLFFGIKPQLSAQHHRDLAAFAQGNLKQADQEYRAAADSDPFGADSRQQRAEYWAYSIRRAAQQAARWGEQERTDFREFVNNGLEVCRELEKFMPGSRRAFEIRAAILADAATALDDDELLQEAIDAQQHAIDCYPTNVRGWFMLTELTSRTDNKNFAANAATQTMQLDEINRRWGHSDRYLLDTELDFLLKLTANDHDK